MPLARDVVKDLAVEHGACVRPVQLRRTDLATGETEPVLVPCGHTLASRLPVVRRTGQEPARRAVPGRLAPRPRTGHRTRRPHRRTDSGWIEKRADAQADARRRPKRRGDDITGWDELARRTRRARSTSAGMRGNVLPARPERRHRSTRRRHDAPPLPKRDGRPPHGRQDLHHAGRQDLPAVLFITLTCPSYGRVNGRRNAGRPGRLRLHLGGAGRAALRRALRPVHAEPSPLLRLRRPVLRRDRAATTARAARPHRHARHRLTRRTPRGHRRDLSPGVVAVDRHACASTAATCPSGTKTRPPTSTRHRRSPAHLGRGARRHRRRGRAAARRPVRRPLRRPRRARRVEGRQPVHRLPDQVPDQARRRLPPRRDRRPGAPRRPARRRAPLRAVLADLRELAPLRHPAQERQAQHAAGRAARARRTAANTSATPAAACSSPASGPARPSPTTAPTARTGSMETLGLPATDPTRYAWEPVSARRPRPHAHRAAAAPRRRRPHPLATRARPGAKTRSRPSARRHFGNRGGGMTS